VRSSPACLKFGGNNGFQAELRRRVAEHFRSTGRQPRDCPTMYLKTVVILAWFAGSYALLVFAASAWWQCLPLAVLVGLALGAIGFNIQHDGGHHAYSRREWVNRLAARSLELVGASSYIWHWKHDVFHHTSVNVTGEDTDIDLGLLARLSPHQRRRSFHRWQHLYLWPLYSFLTIKWQLFDDFHDMIVGRVGRHRVPRARGWDLVSFLVGKLVFFALAFAVPLAFRPVWAVLLWYGVASLVLGLVSAVVFQLAHCVPQAAFPLPGPDTGRMDNPWAVHQVETTVDFARTSRLTAWFLGGLNFQIEHHLFPRICHVNYPALSGLVEQTCREFGVRYARHASIVAGVAAHYRWLRHLGAADGAPA
jgi:linoleoyl-CoA desaturase